MNCETCKHNFVCKYKEEYIRVKEKSNSDEFKGIFDIYCNEYIECEYLDFSNQNVKTEPTYRGFKVEDEVRFIYKDEEHMGTIKGISKSTICIKSGVWHWYPMCDKITDMRYINQQNKR